MILHRNVKLMWIALASGWAATTVHGDDHDDHDHEDPHAYCQDYKAQDAETYADESAEYQGTCACTEQTDGSVDLTCSRACQNCMTGTDICVLVTFYNDATPAMDGWGFAYCIHDGYNKVCYHTDSNREECIISVNDQDCNECVLNTDDNSYVADCTNIEAGAEIQYDGTTGEITGGTEGIFKPWKAFEEKTHYAVCPGDSDFKPLPVPSAAYNLCLAEKADYLNGFEEYQATCTCAEQTDGSALLSYDEDCQRCMTGTGTCVFYSDEETLVVNPSTGDKDKESSHRTVCLQDDEHTVCLTGNDDYCEIAVNGRNCKDCEYIVDNEDDISFRVDCTMTEAAAVITYNHRKGELTGDSKGIFEPLRDFYSIDDYPVCPGDPDFEEFSDSTPKGPSSNAQSDAESNAGSSGDDQVPIIAICAAGAAAVVALGAISLVCYCRRSGDGNEFKSGASNTKASEAEPVYPASKTVSASLTTPGQAPIQPVHQCSVVRTTACSSNNPQQQPTPVQVQRVTPIIVKPAVHSAPWSQDVEI